MSSPAGVPVFTLADGRIVEWNSGFPAPPPMLPDNVWAEFTRSTSYWAGTSSTGYSASIRDVEGGTILWLQDQIDPRFERGEMIVESLFGAQVRYEAGCITVPFRASCHEVAAQLFDYVVETTPEQRIPFGVLTRVTTESGVFDVMSALSDLASTRQPPSDCAPVPVGGRMFAVSRVPE